MDKNCIFLRGLITFREALILCDPENTSSMTKQNIALVTGHELAHMWFGNLVSDFLIIATNKVSNFFNSTQGNHGLVDRSLAERRFR